MVHDSVYLSAYSCAAIKAAVLFGLTIPVLVLE